jgi:hypothetical protein
MYVIKNTQLVVVHFGPTSLSSPSGLGPAILVQMGKHLKSNKKPLV